MISNGSIRENVSSGDVFMIVPIADRFRWVGTRSEEADLLVAKVRHSPVVQSWEPLPVKWLPETEARPTCDFPIFFPIVRCISRRAAEVLDRYLSGALELLPLEGLSGKYVGVHCVNWLSAADFSGIDTNRTSIHSTLFIPLLRASVVSSHDIFGVPEMVSKVFVSLRVKEAIEGEGLLGLEFHKVPLV